MGMFLEMNKTERMKQSRMNQMWDGMHVYTNVFSSLKLNSCF